jgi:uncharacterized membrane protein YfcA
MTIYILTTLILLLSITCTAVMIIKFRKQPTVKVSTAEYIKLSISGVLAFISDTIGVGSFAINVALAKLLNTFPDEDLPAVNNGAQVIPGTLESLFFMQLVTVDLTTLITLVTGTCIGGLLGGTVVSKLSKQSIRLAMLLCFGLIIALLIGEKLQLLPVGGEVMALHSGKLLLGFLALIICGALTSVGIGLFVMVQGVLFVLHVSPLVAFPIMTTAGAMQQPLTTLVFLKNDKIPLKKTLILSLAGCVGVLITLPLFTNISVSSLHTLLLAITIYNLAAISRSYFKEKANKLSLHAVGANC